MPRTRTNLLTIVISGSLGLLAGRGVVAATAAPQDEAWSKAALDGLAAREYRFSWQDGVLSAPNRAQDLRTRLEANGFSIVSRTKGAEAFRLDLALEND